LPFASLRIFGKGDLALSRFLQGTMSGSCKGAKDALFEQCRQLELRKSAHRMKDHLVHVFRMRHQLTVEAADVLSVAGRWCGEGASYYQHKGKEEQRRLKAMMRC
jgi:hypothetical protein